MAFPCLPVQEGPSTPFAKKMRPYHALVLFLMTLLGLGRIFVIKDIVGSVPMFLAIAIGVMALRKDMNVTLMSMYCIICLVNAGFNGYRSVDTALHTPTSEKELVDKYGSPYNAVLFIIQAIPILDLSGAFLALLVYKDYRRKRAGGFAAGDQAARGLTQQDAARPAANDDGHLRAASAPTTSEAYKGGSNYPSWNV
eukprot:TRINITY_DN39164_c0_g1_i1.p1 TRINITY_DN39164_c0_g1~~TRINITY_DN39164_c0_g1_i1.p1  ORF type:complete len:197 (-),score=27.06 TRINITY_DN39164_c0_g1_i1:151-741(-)